MPEASYDLREIARSALNEMPEAKRAVFLTERLIELSGPQALELLSQAQVAVRLRMQELIDEKLPLDDLLAIYGGAAAVHARMVWPNSLNACHDNVFAVARAVVADSGEDR